MSSVQAALLPTSFYPMQAEGLRRGSGGDAAQRRSPPSILDIPTPLSDGVRTPVRCTLSKVSRRLFSRCILGLRIPGKYYFITWTSSPQSPPIEKSWPALRQWLKAYRPGSCWCYCVTTEGYGVIHMIMRLGKGEQRLDVRKVRSHWIKLHNAVQIKIKYVPESMKNNLAAYLGDQRKLKSLGGEMAWQNGIVRWHWSKGWLPKGFTKAFGRVWYCLDVIPSEMRDIAVKTWLLRCHIDAENVFHPPDFHPPEVVCEKKVKHENKS